MARVLALIPDLLFGSRVQGMLIAQGHEVELIPGEAALRSRLEASASAPAQALVVDLTDADLDGSAIVESLSTAGELAGIRTLGFYSHVDVSARERAQHAGFDLIVPRSRMAREGGELVTRLSAATGV